MILTSILAGAIGTGALLGVYFAAVGSISGWTFAIGQFSQFWYFIAGLAAGFGIQVGLYAYLRSAIRASAPKSVLVASGATSTAAMISCCSHYLATLLPALGVSGIASFLGEYQVEFFWFGLAANAFGIALIARRVMMFSRKA